MWNTCSCVTRQHFVTHPQGGQQGRAHWFQGAQEACGAAASRVVPQLLPHLCWRLCLERQRVHPRIDLRLQQLIHQPVGVRVVEGLLWAGRCELVAGISSGRRSRQVHVRAPMAAEAVAVHLWRCTALLPSNVLLTMLTLQKWGPNECGWEARLAGRQSGAGRMQEPPMPHNSLPAAAPADVKCVSASGAPEGLPLWPACLCESLRMSRLAGCSASFE